MEAADSETTLQFGQEVQPDQIGEDEVQFEDEDGEGEGTELPPAGAGQGRTVAGAPDEDFDEAQESFEGGEEEGPAAEDAEVNPDSLQNILSQGPDHILYGLARGLMRRPASQRPAPAASQPARGMKRPASRAVAGQASADVRRGELAQLDAGEEILRLARAQVAGAPAAPGAPAAAQMRAAPKVAAKATAKGKAKATAKAKAKAAAKATANASAKAKAKAKAASKTRSKARAKQAA